MNNSRLDEYKEYLTHSERDRFHASVTDSSNIENHIDRSINSIKWKMANIPSRARERNDTIEIRKDICRIEIAINKIPLLPQNPLFKIEEVMKKYNLCIELEKQFDTQRLNH